MLPVQLRAWSGKGLPNRPIPEEPGHAKGIVLIGDMNIGLAQEEGFLTASDDSNSAVKVVSRCAAVGTPPCWSLMALFVAAGRPRL